MKVRIQRLIEDGEVMGWAVDLDEHLLPDTSSRFFTREEDARRFARELSDLLITAPVVQAEDDVL
jgi:hypothetical protein